MKDGVFLFTKEEFHAVFFILFQLNQMYLRVLLKLTTLPLSSARLAQRCIYFLPFSNGLLHSVVRILS